MVRSSYLTVELRGQEFLPDGMGCVVRSSYLTVGDVVRTFHLTVGFLSQEVMPHGEVA